MKAHFKKFLMKRLEPIQAAIKVRPLSEYENFCIGDKVCIPEFAELPSSELEATRAKHRTALLEFFFGSDDGKYNQSIIANYPKGFIMNQMLDIPGPANIEAIVGLILDGKARGHSSQPMRKRDKVSETKRPSRVNRKCRLFHPTLLLWLFQFRPGGSGSKRKKMEVGA
jgi:hypothetical protein